MKSPFILSICLLFGASTIQAQDLVLKIMSFNIQQPYGTDWDVRKAKVATIIKNEKPDVIGSQEAVNYQRDYMKTETGYAWHGTGRDGGDAGEGSWIFYNSAKFELDINNSGNFWMSNTPTIPSRFGGAYNRICTYARLVNKTDGNAFYIFNAHFPTPDLSSERLQSMKLLMNRVMSRAILTDPVYITGDFNSTEQDAVTIWAKNGSDNPLKCRDTYRDIDPTGYVSTGFGTKFDYIYCPASTKYTTISSSVITSPTGASDHMPIVATVKYSKSDTPTEPLKIPGKVESEAYATMSGIQKETTTDIGGGLNIGFIDGGDWLKYSINVSKTTKYDLELRLASKSSNGKIAILIDNVLSKTITLPITGDWQKWDSYFTSLDLSQGNHELKIEIIDGGFNLNWINFTEQLQDFYADYDQVDISFTGFGGSNFQEVTNPFVSTGNTSSKVGSTKKGADTWAGIFSQNLNSINFIKTPILKMDVYTPKNGDLLIKFEDKLDDKISYSLTYPMTQANQWTEISIDFSKAPSGEFEKIVLFFGYGQTSTDTYYFDNLRLESVVLGNSEVLNTKPIFASPNPVNDKLYFSEECSWSIYDLNGLKIKEAYSNSTTIEGLNPGVYILSINNEKQKIIIE